MLQDSATYADMSSVSSKNQKQGDEEGQGGYEQCVCVYACHDVSVLGDSETEN